MKDLIAALESAAGPQFKLDCLIWGAIGGDALVTPPPFTGSINHALTLVPEGWTWQVSNRATEPHTGRAYIHNRQLHYAGIAAQPNPERRAVETTAATPAIALTIAALKARDAEQA